MKYQVQENCLTVFLPEELDHHNTEEIREKTDRLIEEHQIKCVIFLCRTIRSSSFENWVMRGTPHNSSAYDDKANLK